MHECVKKWSISDRRVFKTSLNLVNKKQKQSNWVNVLSYFLLLGKKKRRRHWSEFTFNDTNSWSASLNINKLTHWSRVKGTFDSTNQLIPCPALPVRLLGLKRASDCVHIHRGDVDIYCVRRQKHTSQLLVHQRFCSGSDRQLLGL